MIDTIVKLNSSYNIKIGYALGDLGIELTKIVPKCTIAVVTEENVAKLYLDTVKNSLENAGYKVVIKVVKAGEKYKNFDTFKEIIDFLSLNRLTRQDAVLSLGGGVISDMAGFSAGCYLRGIKHIIVPTTLLSIIDASIGGKTGIDLATGKNLVGAFYQPTLVYSDLTTLSTLDQNNLLCGIGEGLKYALLAGGECLEILLEGLNEDNFERFVASCVEYKTKIVMLDEKEGNMRKLLNYGHTFGHAVEQASNYNIPHGVAVVLGIKMMNDRFRCGLTDNDLAIIDNLTKKYGFDKFDLPTNSINQYILADKKRGLNDTIDIVVLEKIGKPIIKTVKVADLCE